MLCFREKLRHAGVQVVDCFLALGFGKIPVVVRIFEDRAHGKLSLRVI